MSEGRQVVSLEDVREYLAEYRVLVCSGPRQGKVEWIPGAELVKYVVTSAVTRDERGFERIEDALDHYNRLPMKAEWLGD